MQLEAEAAIKKLKEEKAFMQMSLSKANEELTVQATRLQTLHQRAANSALEAEQNKRRSEELESELKTAKSSTDAVEIRATALEEAAKATEAFLAAKSAELEAALAKLKVETEARREAQLTKMRAQLEEERTKKSHVKLGGDFAQLRKQYDALQETNASHERALELARAGATDLENKIRELLPFKDGYHAATAESHRLALRLQELKSISDSQIMSLTDARDRYAQQ